MSEKLKITFYWAASCGGCEVAVLDINEKILDVVAIADILFWPVALDIKYKDIEAMPDKHIDVTFFNGGIRTSEGEHMANLFRRKTKTLVAFGSCACTGSIPGLANLSNKDEIFQTAYMDTISTVNPDKIVPKTSINVEEGILTLPEFYNTLKTLDQTVEVDYYLPGCPPPVKLISTAIDAIASGDLPPKGSIIAPVTALCDECPREKQDKDVTAFKRPYEILNTDPNLCFLDQGIICMGIATRSGCEAACLSANWPCTGCGGATPESKDQGMNMVSAIASMAGLENEENLSDQELESLFDQIKDPMGTFYMYSLADSILKRRVIK
ncbi:MAG: F420-non-reducing hydrogenase iron-sulfur subunit G [Candidatus Heimdallarchaeota archaeon LC_3]|nr:MAG: F420-non-reducing hydrogenase iron-sulfur subunit G [Candidatus Heimdallarchaeota archaeon LC_3]